MDFKKNNPFAAFGFGAPKSGAGGFSRWGRGAADTSAYARVDEATERLFSSLGESMRGGAQSPYAEMMENFFRQNNIAGPQRDSYMQMFVEMNQVAGQMLLSIVQQQQQYLLQLLQMTGQVAQKQYDPNQQDKRCNEESRAFTERTAKHCAAVSNTIMQANQEIYQRFMKMCHDGGGFSSSDAFDGNGPAPQHEEPKGEWPFDEQIAPASGSTKAAAKPQDQPTAKMRNKTRAPRTKKSPTKKDHADGK